MRKEKKEYQFEQFDLQIKQDESGPMIIMTSVFMLWGFITVMNDSLSGKIKEALLLTSEQEELLSVVFFAGYFLVGLIIFLLCRYVFDPFIRFGYKRMLIFGLFVTALGCFMFYPAVVFAEMPNLAQNQKYNFFLASTVMLSAGFTILQITANSYVISLGKEETASARINLSQGFNSLGTYLAPIISTLLFLESDFSNEVSSIRTPYIVLGLAVLLLAFLFSISVLPDIKFDQPNAVSKSIKNEKQLLLGALAIFLYVGGEVAIGSHLGDFMQLEYIADFDQVTAQKYTALYWGGAMVGRFTGAAFLARIESRTRGGIVILLILLCYLLSLSISGDNIMSIIFTLLFLVNLLAFQLGSGRSAKTVGVFGAIVILLIVISMFNTGYISMWSLIIIGMFNSIMFPTIFRLGLSNLGHKTSIGSSLLVLAIVGGALIPYIQTYLIHHDVSIQNSFVIPALCYVFISYYGFTTFRENG